MTALVRNAIAVAGIGLMNAVFVKIGLPNLVRAERYLAYLQVLTESTAGESRSGVHFR